MHADTHTHPHTHKILTQVQSRVSTSRRRTACRVGKCAQLAMPAKTECPYHLSYKRIQNKLRSTKRSADEKKTLGNELQAIMSMGASTFCAMNSGPGHVISGNGDIYSIPPQARHARRSTPFPHDLCHTPIYTLHLRQRQKLPQVFVEAPS